MKKLIFKFWAVNLLASIVLYFAYRFAIIIANTDTSGLNWLEKILNILDVLLNIYFALIYLLLIVFSSLIFFLNLIPFVRNNYILSFLTFSGIPLFFIIYFVVSGGELIADIFSHNPNFFTTFVVFLAIYLFFTSIEFLIFRRKITTKNLL